LQKCNHKALTLIFLVTKMVNYHMKLGDFEIDIDVPRRIKGLHRLADYICADQARKYAKATTKRLSFKQRRVNETNWYDSHIDPITELLLDLREKLRDRHGE